MADQRKSPATAQLPAVPGSDSFEELRREALVTEVDYAGQDSDLVRVHEAYLTPGFEWTVRGKLELAVGASIGLTDTSEDWMAHLSMGVRF